MASNLAALRAARRPAIAHQSTIDARFPPKLQFLFEPHRYKVVYGGRGSGKSWGMARALLILGQQYLIRVLCARETMTSIAASVHQLLCDQIYALGLQDHYEIGISHIRGVNGTQFSFIGLRANITQVKSFEGLTICWVEEAANVSSLSWDTLIPTMRGEGFLPGTPSEIWVTFNPELETDATYRQFILNTPPNAVVVEMNHCDNDWFPLALTREMEQMKRLDYDKYLNIYEGQCRQFLEGAVYTKELKHASEITMANPHSRIRDIKYNPDYPVSAYFDLGWADAVAIWIVQKIDYAVHFLRYIEGSRRTIDSYVNELDNLPYPITTYALPPDAKQKTLASNGRSVESMLRQKGKNVVIVPNLSLTDGINATRTLLPTAHFDAKHCAKGLHALRHYRFEVIEDGLGGFKDKPVHDQYCHAADSARYVAIGLRNPKKKPDPGKYAPVYRHYVGHQANTGWMSM